MNGRAVFRQPDALALARQAQELLQEFDRLCIPALQFRQVNARDFPGLNLFSYEQIGATLAGFGYRVLGDVQSDLPQPAQYAPTFMRIAQSSDGSNLALFRHVVLPRQQRWRQFFQRFSWDRGYGELMLLTEFDNGKFCMSVAGQQRNDLPAGFTAQFLPLDLSSSTTALRHKQLLQRFRRDNPELGTRHHDGLQDALDCLRRAHEQEVMARMVRGSFSDAELWRRGHDPQLARQLVQEMRRLRGLAPSTVT